MTTPTTPQAAFLQAICESPHDDGPRLMYADWLEERGEQLERAEFIRVQCAIATLDAELMSDEDCEQPDCSGCVERRPLQKRERELLASDSHYGVSNRARWLGDICNTIIPDEQRGRISNESLAELLARLPIIANISSCNFRRGFVERVVCTMQCWLDHGPALVQATPLLEVQIVGMRPFVFYPEPPESVGWFLDTDLDNYSVPPAIYAKLSGKKLRANDDWSPRCLYSVGMECNGALIEDVIQANDAALNDLSCACISWAREEVGLPELRKP